ncbi:hypothetical protein TBK1r_42910 [Stieleria magnilauensis]|uniref:Uncharacterized protein n=1 Tax=Stieleria magnilauensis TaxID=2527963 RepID=A0ABX5XTI3_9BACT|nr:hypothetical protein TBK1r_42910 [Planctomycetes bacterium TBK1r]
MPHVTKGSISYTEGLAVAMAVVCTNGHAICILDHYERIRERSDAEQPVLMLMHSNKRKHLVMIGNNEKEKDE